MVPDHQLGDVGQQATGVAVCARRACHPHTPRLNADMFLIVASSCLQSKKANFDASHELEELLLEDNPLKARQRKVQDINNLSAEMRQMEEQYVGRSIASDWVY